MSEEIRIQNYTAEEICELLLGENRRVCELLAAALTQMIHEMAGLHNSPSAADLLRQLEEAA